MKKKFQVQRCELKNFEQLIEEQRQMGYVLHSWESFVSRTSGRVPQEYWREVAAVFVHDPRMVSI